MAFGLRYSTTRSEQASLFYTIRQCQQQARELEVRDGSRRAIQLASSLAISRARLGILRKLKFRIVRRRVADAMTARLRAPDGDWLNLFLLKLAGPAVCQVPIQGMLGVRT